MCGQNYANWQRYIISPFPLQPSKSLWVSLPGWRGWWRSRGGCRRQRGWSGRCCEVSSSPFTSHKFDASKLQHHTVMSNNLWKDLIIDERKKDGDVGEEADLVKRRDKKRRITEVGKWMQQMRSGTINMTDREDWEGKKSRYLQKIPHYDIDYSK